VLLEHDRDGFNRWNASQQLAVHAYRNLRDGGSTQALDAWSEALARLFDTTAVDDALLAELLSPPGETELAAHETPVDPGQIHQLRQDLRRQLAARLGAAVLERRYQALHAGSGSALDATSQGRRRLKHRLLGLLALLDQDRAWPLAAAQFGGAAGMTDRLAALSVLAHSDIEAAAPMLAQFRARHAHDPLALDKWFTVQAQVPGPTALERVVALEHDPDFTWHNPNRINALFAAFARSNPSGFHRADGAGYRLLTARLAMLDRVNPQIAARLATAFNDWQGLEPVRREAARAAIERLAAGGQLSPNLTDLLQRMLRH